MYLEEFFCPLCIAMQSNRHLLYPQLIDCPGSQDYKLPIFSYLFHRCIFIYSDNRIGAITFGWNSLQRESICSQKQHNQGLWVLFVEKL